MNRIKQKFEKIFQLCSDYIHGNGLMQEENAEAFPGFVTPEAADAARRCGAESCVLLKNDGVLPLKETSPVAVFGRCQLDWFYVGYGSGGDVKAPYYVNLMDGLKNASIPYDMPLAQVYEDWCHSEDHKARHGIWGHWPMSHPEMPLEEALVAGAAARCDTALVVIGRAAGEDRENALTPGSFYLTDAETAMLDAVTTHFTRTVVILNVGSILDMAWTERYGDKLSALLFAWQGGMESGNALADVLTGKVTPSGRLADTIAESYDDYPSSTCFGGKAYNNYEEDIFVGYRYFDTFAREKVLYPFGYGLSYTTFRRKLLRFSFTDGTCAVRVTNTGNFTGKETVLLFCRAPQGVLGKAARVLVGYAKTGELAPGEETVVTVTFDPMCLASYDDLGKTGVRDAFVLEAGEYRFYLEEKQVASHTLESLQILRRCERALAVRDPFLRMTAVETGSMPARSREQVPGGKSKLRRRIASRLPEDVFCTGDRGYKLADVINGKICLDEFIGQLSAEELEGLTRGEGTMDSTLGISGNAGAFGGILPSLREKGIAPIITCDGPAGLRIKRQALLVPCGTAQACTFDDALIEELYTHVGREMTHHGVDVLLGPGMNLHRNPLCGRNFEYFSEDPLLTGRMAAAVVRGIQSQGHAACPKHFACNNQEVSRNTNDSRVSGRALRELYLRSFEIMVKGSSPLTIMTSYNKINGVWSHYNYDLATTLLRDEWGFDGVVITDWWMQKSVSPEFPGLRDNAYRVRAQVDVLMPGNMNRLKKGYHTDGTLLKGLGKPNGITRGELQRTARNVLNLLIRLNKV